MNTARFLRGKARSGLPGYRVPRPVFDETLESFVTRARIAPEYIPKITNAVLRELERRQQSHQGETMALKAQIAELEEQAKVAASNLKFIRHPSALRYAERDLLALDEQIKSLEAGLPKDDGSHIGYAEIEQYVRSLGDNMRQLILECGNGAAGFALLFDSAPTYDELKDLDSANISKLFTLA